MPLYLENPFEFAEDLKSDGIPFKMIVTTFTKTIILRDGKTYKFTQSGKLKNVDLNLIRLVKNHAEKITQDGFSDTGEFVKGLSFEVDRADIGYTKVNDKFKNGIYKRDIWEIDLNAAYWNLALKYGAITQEIFNKGMNLDEMGNSIEPKYNKYGQVYNLVSKMARLISMGNLAKVQTVFDFDGKKYGIPQQVRSEGTENIFFKVSQETDVIMRKLIALCGSSALFYWVDAIFLKGEEAKNLVCDFLTNEIGMNFKIVKLYKLLKTSSYVSVWDETNIDENENMVPRPYIFGKLNKKDYSNLMDIDKNLIYKNHLETFLK